MMTSIKCPKCSSDNADSASFCSDCGTQLGFPKGIPDVTKTLVTSTPQFKPGTLLAERYEIISELGKGGMGEVYLAEDTNLKRQVAVKALPQPFALDKEMLARFEREARLLASLNHPNIATIHGLEKSNGQQFLVMELVGGETLAERVKKGPLPIEEALEVCRQIAEGLEAAHEKGIIHRDLKPANVKITPEGKVKVLDFGLAKAFEKAVSGESGGVDPSKSPTITVESSHSGVILGTAAYMSPEQARGKPLDKRTDIWSFGCVLFEAITGRQAFKGDTISDCIAAILKSEPNWKAMPETTPLKLRDLLRRCLQKDPHNRLHDIADARIDIQDILTGSSIEMVPTVRRAPMWRTLFWASISLVLILICVLLWSPWHTNHPSEQLLSRLVIPTPSLIQSQTVSASSGNIIVISPDGTKLVYVAEHEKTMRLHLREIDKFTANPIPGLGEAYAPFFSPDAQWLGFFHDGKLMKLLLSGGQPSILCDAPAPVGGIWGPDGTIIFGARGEGLMRISSDGGEPEAITAIDFEQGEWIHVASEFLPGEKEVLYTAFNGSGVALHITALNLETRKQQIIIEGGSQAHYAPTGHLVYSQKSSLLAAPFDIINLRITGPSIAILDGIMTNPGAGAQASFSKNGTLIYVQGLEQATERMLVWVNRQGQSQPVMEEKRRFYGPRISPDGKKLAMWIEGQVWIYDIARGTLRRLTSEGQNFWPVWTPDGQRVTFPSIRMGSPDVNLFWKPVDGSTSSERLTQGQYGQQPFSWTPDGKVLLFHQSVHPTTGWDILMLPIDGESTPSPFLDSQFNERRPSLFPDGRWLAYESDESGRPEIYVTTFPNPGSRWQISTQGGSEPAWSRNGRELYYRNVDKMMAVDIMTEPEFTPAKPRLLFEGKYFSVIYGRNYDITPDGQQFVMVKLIEEESVATQINVVLNWFEEIKRLVPTGN
jgi:serine/threonine protein kinase